MPRELRGKKCVGVTKIYIMTEICSGLCVSLSLYLSLSSNNFGFSCNKEAYIFINNCCCFFLPDMQQMHLKMVESSNSL